MEKCGLCAVFYLFPQKLYKTKLNMLLKAFPASFTTFEKIEFSQLKPCFLHVSCHFCTKLAKTHEKRRILNLKSNLGYYIT